MSGNTGPWRRRSKDDRLSPCSSGIYDGCKIVWPLACDQTFMAAIPTQSRSKHLRACLLCSLVQAPPDWKKNGCPNCESILEVGSSRLMHAGWTLTFLVETITRTHSSLHDDSVWWCNCCHRSRFELGCTMAANRCVGQSFLSNLSNIRVQQNMFVVCTPCA